MYSIPVTLYSGVNNPVQVFCLNGDQKKVDVSNLTITMSLFEPNTQNELFSVLASPIDTANGRVLSVIPPAQLEPLDFGEYEISVMATDANNMSWPVYINDTFGSRLTVHYQKGPVNAYADPVTLTWLDQPGIGVASQRIDLMNRPAGSTLATTQIAFTGYTGNVTIMGTMISLPQSVNDWSVVTQQSYANVSGNTFLQAPGSYALMQVVINDIDPSMYGNVTPANIANIVGYSALRF